MNKKQYQQDLRDIKNISNAIRKMNESIMFEDEYDELNGMEQEPMGEPEPTAQTAEPEQMANPEAQPQGEVEAGAEAQANIKDVKPEDEGMAELDNMGELDKIREMTLKGMLKFTNQPEHPQFQALKKIFDICNKGVEQKQENQQGA
jgi:hypothetical protein